MLITVGIFIVVLGIMILVHELGHFLVAKRVGVKILEFNLGMGPRIIGKKWGETEYMIKAFPIGGSVKMLGEEPGESDEECIDPSEAHRAFYRQSPLKRIAITAAGPLLNITLAIILAPMVFMLGIDEPSYLHAKPVLYGVETVPTLSAQAPLIGILAGVGGGKLCLPAVMGAVQGYFSAQGSPAALAGFRKGDEILSAGGVSFQNWQDVIKFTILNPDRTYIFNVKRGSELITVEMTIGKDRRNDTGWAGFIPAGTNIIGSFTGDSPARESGLQPLDKIVAIDDKRAETWEEIVTAVRGSDGKELKIEVERKGEKHTFHVTPHYDRKSKTYYIGITPAILVKYPPHKAIKHGFLFLGEQLGLAFTAIKKLITGQIGRKALGGPIEIAHQVGVAARMGFPYLVKITAIICIWLGVLNLFPFPALDGGHIIFGGIELISRRRLPQKLVDVMNMVGFSLLIALIILVSIQDVMRHWESIKGLFM